MSEFSEKVITILKAIPEGKVVSYGQVADCAGNNRGARAVVYILRSKSQRGQLPWHRVIGKTGQIRIKGAEAYLTQKHLLEIEGVIVSNSGMVDMEIYRWDCHGYDHML